MDANPHPLEIYRTHVSPAWIDYNGHMNEGFYGVAFGDASDAYLMHAGFDDVYRRTIGGTFYTVETHIRFLRELRSGDPLLFRTVVLGVDAKKLHLFHSMVHETEGFEAATQEAFLLHVDLGEPAATPMASELLAAMQRDRESCRGLRPEGLGGAIRPIVEGT